MLESLREIVCAANKALPRHGLVTFTWGNVSAIDREAGLMVIKPSGVEYEALDADAMVVIDMEGRRVWGRYHPSSDTATHLEIYHAFPAVGGIVHTHSTYATAWAQAGRAIPCYGTTHADYIHGEIPCLPCLTEAEIEVEYEKNAGLLIAREYARLGLDPVATPAVLLAQHGPFVWGADADTAVHNAVVVEEVAKMAYLAEMLNGDIKAAPQTLQDKHFFRKHGKDAYYGQ